MNISKIIIEWYNKHKRELPWRKTKNPYLIWVSEVILQQTRVNQGLQYYLNFIKKFPDIDSLSKTNITDVLKLWQGLGYYSRARNMHETAKQITNSYNNIFPDNYNQIIKLKGIGEYTAAAILSFAFNKPYAVIDGNVYRVLSRFFGINKAINNPKNKNEFIKLAYNILDRKQPATYNQAIIEFGALQCIPRNPNCNICPLNSSCYAYKMKCVEKLPVKIKKTKMQNRYINYFVIKYKNILYLNLRESNDIWKKLYDFPSIETKTDIPPENFITSKEIQFFFDKKNITFSKISDLYIHKLSHQKIYARFYLIKIDFKYKKLSEKYIEIKVKDLIKFPVPRLIENYIQNELSVNIKNNLKLKF